LQHDWLAERPYSVHQSALCQQIQDTKYFLGERESEEGDELAVYCLIYLQNVGLSCFIQLALEGPQNMGLTGGWAVVEIMLHQFLGFFSVFLRVVGRSYLLLSLQICCCDGVECMIIIIISISGYLKLI